jgi:hypothetical protein
VQDRSGSMMRDAAGAVSPVAASRWGTLTGALSQVLLQTENKVRWGMQMFSTCKTTGIGFDCAPNPCAVDGLYRAPALGQGAALNEMVRVNRPIQDIGATPTTLAIRVSTQKLQALATPNPKFLLVVTDGEPNCLNQNLNSPTSNSMADPEGAVFAVHEAVAAGFPVFVVGIATAGSNAHATLNRMASEGGRPLDASTKYYSVGTEAQLVAALNTISSLVQACEYRLVTPPPDANGTMVQIDGIPLVQGTDWQFGLNNASVVVQGKWCESLQGDPTHVLVTKSVECSSGMGGAGGNASSPGAEFCQAYATAWCHRNFECTAPGDRDDLFAALFGASESGCVPSWDATCTKAPSGSTTFAVNCSGGKTVNQVAKTQCLDRLTTASCTEFNSDIYNDNCDKVCGP